MSWTTHRLGSEFIALINSNGGSETIGGFYFSDTETKKPKKLPFRTWLAVLIPVLILIAGALLLLLRQQNTVSHTAQHTSNADQLYTHIAETYFFGLTLTPPVVTESQTMENTVNPLEVATADGNQPPAATMTFTPWVVSEYPSVEEFIRLYYDRLALQDFDNAWLMLSEKMQMACCYTGSGAPKDIFRERWGKGGSGRCQLRFFTGL